LAAAAAAAAAQSPSPGSLFTPDSRLADLARDFRARQAGDLVTILVADRASAVSRGSVTSSRTSSASGGVTAIGGKLNPANRVAGAFTDLLNLSGERELQGQGETSRSTTLTTTLTARVVDVLPSGDLVIEGVKKVGVNAEQQTVTVRGIARWNDLGANNLIRSDRLASLDIQVNGKGVVGDAVRRPNFLYRLLLGILPF
jgi:flagellar L-ring protein precursor FlgH